MLDLMRKKAGTWVIKFLLGAIIIVFTFWGVGSWTAQKGNRVATVNGEPISVETYRQTYSRLMDQMRQQFGNNLSDDLLKMLNVDQQALDQVIDQRLLLNEARRLNFNVSRTELVEAIASYPGFQVDGVFNRRRYEALLGNNRMTPESFEAMQERSLLTGKVRNFVTGNAKVTDLEARQWYDWRNGSVNVDFVLFAPEKYEVKGPDDKQARTFFDQKKEQYKTAPMVKAEYLFFDPVAFGPDVTVTPEDILDYYDTHAKEFNTPKKVHARHVLIKIASEASEDDIEKARVRAVNVVRLAREGEDFDKLARQYSEGPSSVNGGDLGFFEKGAMVKPFADKAFSMQPGDVSDPVRTRFGWHVIKVVEVKAAAIQALEQVSAQIKKSLVDSRSKTLAYDEADSAYDASYEGDSLADIAKTRKAVFGTTELFDRTGPPEGIVNRAVFGQAAFELAENEISDIVDAGTGFYLIKTIQKKSAAIPDMTTVRDQLDKDWQQSEKEKAAMKAAGEFLESMRGKAEGWVQAASKAGAQTGETGYFKKTEEIPKIGRSNQVAGAAFKLSSEKPLPDAPLKSDKGFYVIKFKGRQLPDSQAFEKEKGGIKKALLAQKQRDMFSALVATLRENSEIVIEDKYKN